jgi:hypothetical protein
VRLRFRAESGGGRANSLGSTARAISQCDLDRGYRPGDRRGLVACAARPNRDRCF